MAIPDGSLPSRRQEVNATISTAADGLSGIIDCGGATLSSIWMSTAWTAASLTFQASRPGSTADFFDVYGSTGDEITYTTTANRMVTFDPAFWLGIRYIKLRSGTSGSPVAQTAARTLTCLLQAVGDIS